MNEISRDLGIFGFIPISGHYQYQKNLTQIVIELYQFSTYMYIDVDYSFVFAGIKCIETANLALNHTLRNESNTLQAFGIQNSLAEAKHSHQVHWRVNQQIKSYCVHFVRPHKTCVWFNTTIDLHFFLWTVWHCCDYVWHQGDTRCIATLHCYRFIVINLSNWKSFPHLISLHILQRENFPAGNSLNPNEYETSFLFEYYLDSDFFFQFQMMFVYIFIFIDRKTNKTIESHNRR